MSNDASGRSNSTTGIHSLIIKIKHLSYEAVRRISFLSQFFDFSFIFSRLQLKKRNQIILNISKPFFKDLLIQILAINFNVVVVGNRDLGKLFKSPL